jgi:hypothetical protein
MFEEHDFDARMTSENLDELCPAVAPETNDTDSVSL